MASTAVGSCSQFSQHAWKKDLCTNCSKPKSAHKINETSEKSSTSKIQLVSKEDPCTKSVLGQKPDKPIKPNYLASSNQSKNSKTESETSVTSKPSSKNSTPKKDNSHYYQVYDITAKGESGKPVDLNATDEDIGNCSDDYNLDNSCPMATPYTVVDVITSTLEKNRQLAKLKKNISNAPPSLPTTPAPDYSRKCMTIGRKDKKPVEVEDKSKIISRPSKSVDAETKKNKFEMDDKQLKSMNSVSPEHYKPRLYEEIDDEFLEKVASLQNQSLKLQESKEEKVETDVTNDKIVDALIATSNTTATESEKTDKNKNSKKKSEIPKKSFFQKLLGKGNKDNEESHKSAKSEKSLKKNSSSNDVLTDETNTSNSDNVSKKSFELLTTVDNQSIDSNLTYVGPDTKDTIYENGLEMDVVSRKSRISEDFVKEVEEKIETLVKKQSTNKLNMQSSSCEYLDSHSEFEDSNEDGSDFTKVRMSSNKNIMGTSIISQSSESTVNINIRSQTISGSCTLKYPSNRKSMTPAEAKLARKMLIAPPPPPPTNLSSSVSPVQSKLNIDATATNKLTVLKSGDVIGQPNCQSPTEDVFKSPNSANKTSLMDGFMADLDEILKRDGFGCGDKNAANQSNTLPNLLSKNLDKNLKLASMTTGRLTATMTNDSTSNTTTISTTTTSSNNCTLQQRALPDLPLLSTSSAAAAASLPTTTSMSPSRCISPDGNCNLYEVLPHASDKKKPPPPEIPKPAPRAAIRSVTMATRKSKNKDKLDSNVNKNNGDDGSNGANVIFINRDVMYNVNLDDSLENRFRELSKFTHLSLQQYLNVAMTTPGYYDNEIISAINVDFGKIEKNIVHKIECKSEPRLKWKFSIFYEVDVSDFEILNTYASTIVVMVKKQFSPNPKKSSEKAKNLLNDIQILYSFESKTELSKKHSNFLKTNPNDSCIFHILPYSNIFTLAEIILNAKNEISTPITDKLASILSTSPPDKQLLPWKWVAMTILTVLDNLVNNKDCQTNLKMEDIILVTLPIQLTNNKSDDDPTDNKTTMDKLYSSYHVTKMSEENEGKNFDVTKNKLSNEKQVIEDLIKLIKTLIDLVSSCKKSITPPVTTTENGEKTPLPKSRVKSVSPPNVTSSSAMVEQKCQKFLKKIERVIQTNGLKSWADIMKLRNSLELCFWGPESDEDLKIAAIEPNRHVILGGWLSVSRGLVLTELIEYCTAHPGEKVDEEGSEESQKNKLKEVNSRFECLRKAQFLNDCSVDMLLDAIKWIFF